MSKERPTGNEVASQLEKFQAIKSYLTVNGEKNENGGFTVSNKISERKSAIVTFLPATDTQGEVLHFGHKSESYNPKLGTVITETWRTTLEKSNNGEIMPSASVQIDAFQQFSPGLNHGQPAKDLEIPEFNRDTYVKFFLSWIDSVIQE